MSVKSDHDPVVAGLAYFAIVFGIAFIFGAIRVTILIPRVGELLGVVIECPVILAVSWLASRWSIRKFRVPPELFARLVMGITAFSLLMTAELALATVIFGKKASEFVADLISSDAQAIGFGGQVLYGLFPIIEGSIAARGKSTRTSKRE